MDRMRSCTLGDSPPPWAAEVGWRSAADRAGARSPRRRPRAAAVQCTRCACTRSRAQEARTARVADVRTRAAGPPPCHTGATLVPHTHGPRLPPTGLPRAVRARSAGQLAPARAPPYARCAHRVPVCGQGGPKPPKLPIAIAMQAPMQALNHRRGERDGRRQPLLREERGGDGGGRSAHDEADRHRALPQRGGLVPCSGQHSSGLALFDL